MTNLKGAPQVSLVSRWGVLHKYNVYKCFGHSIEDLDYALDFRSVTTTLACSLLITRPL